MTAHTVGHTATWKRKITKILTERLFLTYMYIHQQSLAVLECGSIHVADDTSGSPPNFSKECVLLSGFI